MKLYMLTFMKTDMQTLTPNQAAKAADCSRPTIMAALKSGALAGVKSNKGWQIDPEALERWIASRTRRKLQKNHGKPPEPDMYADMKLTMQTDMQVQIQELHHKVGKLEGTLDAQNRLLERVEAENEALTRQLSEERSKGFLRRLFS